MKVILVLSGKGGVGKSSVSVQLALSLLLSGSSVGLLDVDLCGPSVPKMLGLAGEKVHQTGSGWEPVYFAKKMPVMSIAFLLPNEDDSVVWRGPKKNSMIKQFCESVNWGELEYLIVDTPPGTSDEHLSLVENFPNAEAILVTTPQLVALQDVQKEINFCRTTGIKMIGLIENMSGYKCPHCDHCTNIFSSGGGQDLALKNDLKLLGTLPIEAKVGKLLDGKAKVIGDEQLLEEFKATQLYPSFQAIILELTHK